MHLLGQPPLETRVTQMNCIFNVPSPASGPGGSSWPPWQAPGPGPNPPVLEPRAVDRSCLWGGVPAPLSFDLSALLGSPGNPCKPAPLPLHPRASQLSSNFGQSMDARSSEAHGGLGEGDTGFARTWGVRGWSQPSLRAPGGSPQPVRIPCLNRQRPAFSCRTSSVLTALPELRYLPPSWKDAPSLFTSQLPPRRPCGVGEARVCPRWPRPLGLGPSLGAAQLFC